MKRLLASSVITALALCGAAQARQQPATPPPAGNPGQSGTSNPVQPAGQQNGQTGQPIQPGVQNPVGQPGQTPVGQNPASQPGQGGAINPVGQPGRTPIGQNPAGQPGQGTSINPIGQPGRNAVGQNGMINGQPRQNSIRQVPGTGVLPDAYQSGIGLYQSPDIRRTLNLTTAQIDRLNAANALIQQRYRDRLTRTASLPADQRAAELERLRASQLNDFYTSGTGVFTPEQLRRYRQLEYQYQGPAAFIDPDVQRQLNLTDAQLRRFRLIQQNVLGPQAFLLNSDGSIRTNGLQEYNAYRQHTNEQMDSILSQEQRDRWRDLTGDPYNFGPYVSSVFVR
jgi:hypothetical protein